MPTRTFTRAELDALGLPDDMPSAEYAAKYPEAAVELHREQVDSRRWVSVHELVFRAPDDGKAYRVTYVAGLTEHQDVSPWEYEGDTVDAVEVEPYERRTIAWCAVEPREEQQPEADDRPGRTAHIGPKEAGQ
ncbi:hypothetical protein ACFU99_08645 [Streptomyces sp. NPDC057654]|uniref:hypothetical protein n=1 Tax=Streptomyces sp. NPDC057654 TaxID=3346196 RepID=UPI0036ADE0BC